MHRILRIILISMLGVAAPALAEGKNEKKYKDNMK